MDDNLKSVPTQELMDAFDKLGITLINRHHLEFISSRAPVIWRLWDAGDFKIVTLTYTTPGLTKLFIEAEEVDFMGFLQKKLGVKTDVE
jgi:hypothetical protein